MTQFKKSDLVEFISSKDYLTEQSVWSFGLVMDVRENVLGGSTCYGSNYSNFEKIEHPVRAEILIISVDRYMISWFDELCVKLVNKD